ncbi:MAG: 16S rRNA (uracil(1498)-N(3))-methyltransferase [Bacteroidaceae bacterium]|nr:16S rRNA (uracil(1498)-N(3))-methyltransferase [Bacteroidaceae bacterium]
MKEERFFYDPQVSGELPSEEAHHAIRVLRQQVGDEIKLMDGKGTFYRAVITAATGHRCLYRIEETLPQQPAWQGHLHLAMAPTKLMDRVEWFAEKATEIGFDELTFLDCQFSERRVVKEERIEKILVSAMKQSHKAWKPMLNEMKRFGDFIKQEREGDKFICHCYDMKDVEQNSSKPLLMEVLRRGVDTTVLIGPEGDFSLDEVRLALQNGYHSVSLGRSRLRTETAALASVHMMQLKNSI